MHYSMALLVLNRFEAIVIGWLATSLKRQKRSLGILVLSELSRQLEVLLPVRIIGSSSLRNCHSFLS